MKNVKISAPKDYASRHYWILWNYLDNNRCEVLEYGNYFLLSVKMQNMRNDAHIDKKTAYQTYNKRLQEIAMNSEIVTSEEFEKILNTKTVYNY